MSLFKYNLYIVVSLYLKGLPVHFQPFGPIFLTKKCFYLKGLAGELVNVLREAGQVVPASLLKFGTHVKKKVNDQLWLTKCVLVKTKLL